MPFFSGLLPARFACLSCNCKCGYQCQLKKHESNSLTGMAHEYPRWPSVRFESRLSAMSTDLSHRIMAAIGIRLAQHALRLIPPFAIHQKSVRVRAGRRLYDGLANSARTLLQVNRPFLPWRQVAHPLRAPRGGRRKRESLCAPFQRSGSCNLCDPPFCHARSSVMLATGFLRRFSRPRPNPLDLPRRCGLFV